MDEPRREMELKVGRRTQDGTVSLSTLIPQMLTLRVTYGAERSSAVQLTLEQVGELRRALAEIERSIVREQSSEQWDGRERRRPAA
jgi:hypothetical protein